MYRDNVWVKSTWYGNDVLTLTVAVPVLITALIFSKRGSVRSQFVWLRMLFYSFYNYAFYLFGAAILLWKHQPWGYVLRTMVMISGTLYMLVLIAHSRFGEHADVAGAWDMFPLWVVLAAGCLVSSGLLLWNIQPVSDTKEVKI